MANNCKNLQSVNQLYMKSQEREDGISFKEWLDPLKRKFTELSNNPDTNTGMDFGSWLNKVMANRDKKRQMIINSADAEVFVAANDKPSIESPDFVPSNLEEQEAKRKFALKDKSVFGMKPFVFYSVTAAVAIAIATGVFFYIKNRNKK
jgi:hypothetical protein